MQLEALLEQAKRGEAIPESVLIALRRELATAAEDSDPYTLIHILWKSRDPQSEPLFRNALGSSDEMVRRIALQALANQWPSEEVFETACALLANDPSDYVYMIAASTIGDLGARFTRLAPRAARLLLDAFEGRGNRTEVDPDDVCEGLMNLMRVPMTNRPRLSVSPKQIDPDVIAAAKALAASMHG